MTFKGVVKNGVIVLPEKVKLPDGLEVEVRVWRPSKRDWEKFMANCVGVADDAPDVSRHHHRYFAEAVIEHARAKKKAGSLTVVSSMLPLIVATTFTQLSDKFWKAHTRADGF